MQTLSLNGPWHLKRISTGDIYPATVPGIVHTDLMDADVVGNPYYRDNEQKLAWIGEEDWSYDRQFIIDASMANFSRKVLRFDGLDTFASIRLNGSIIGETDNMFRRFEYDVTEILHPRENHLEVIFSSPLKRAAAIAKTLPYPIPYTGEQEWYIRDTHRNLVRKCQCHGGWDWGPAFLTSGIWKDVSIIGFDYIKIDAVKPVQFHEENCVHIHTVLYTDVIYDGSYQFSLALAGEKASKHLLLHPGRQEVAIELTVKHPELWWPKGYGHQTLHPLEISVACNDHLVAEASQRLGLRKVELVQDDDAHGQSFYFKVNNVPVFLKGYNWIPVDCFTSRMSREVYADLIDSAVEANCNVLRVWGGGIYESDIFYDQCDEQGLLVWQDFMFACAMYPWDDAFLANVVEEVKEAIRRLARHPSLLLWCGNNECEMALDWYPEARANPDLYRSGYHRLFIDTIAPLVKSEAPEIPYWPSSPSNGTGIYGDSNERSQGDTHYWEVWHGGKPFSEYLTVVPRMSSEYGFQSVPSLETLKPVLRKEDGDYNIASPMMDYRQRSAIGNRAIVEHMMGEYRLPADFEQFIYLSQVQQAMAMKTATEHWRRLMPINMGTMIWQINDIWPGNSWSSIEYGGKWKVLHSVSKRFFAPVLLSLAKKGDHVEVWITNDGPNKTKGRFMLEVRNFSGEILQQWSDDYEVSPLESECYLSLNDDAFKRFGNLNDIFLVLYDGDKVANWELLSPAKYCSIQNPTIQVETNPDDERARIVLQTDYPVFHLWLEIPGRHGRFDDNGILLLPDKPRTIQFTAKDGLETIQCEQIHLYYLEENQ